MRRLCTCTVSLFVVSLVTMLFERVSSFVVDIDHWRFSASRNNKQPRHDHIITLKQRGRTTFQLSASVATTEDDELDQILDARFLKRNKYWVVLVDDEESIRLAVGDYLYDEGYQVTACADAAALLDEVLSKDGTSRLPDAIISDIRMPTTDGIQLLTKIRQNSIWARIPVVLLTAKGLTADRVAGYQAGADAYLTKPFDPEELLSMLDNVILRRKQLENHTPSGLSDLQQELASIKQLMQENAQKVVKSTQVFLNETERPVLERLCEGYTNAEIAQSCDLSVDKVARTISKLYRTTKCQTRTELVRWAFSTGYASPHN